MESLKSLIVKKKRQRWLGKPVEIYELFEVWNKNSEKIFGKKNARCWPKALRGKVLIIGVNSAPLATELQFRQSQLIELINRHFGKKIVNRIVFKL